MKETGGDFFAAWGGIASLQLSLSGGVDWRARARRRRRNSRRVDVRRARRVSRGSTTERGGSPPGYDADIVDLGSRHELSSSTRGRLEHRHHVTPYAGRELFGVVRATYVGGQSAFDAMIGHRNARVVPP